MYKLKDLDRQSTNEKDDRCKMFFDIHKKNVYLWHKKLIKHKTMKKILNLILLLLFLTMAAACNKSDDDEPINTTPDNTTTEPENNTTNPEKNEHKKVGLVLSGGGAKGAAEIGALKVIEKQGFKIEYIAGTSIGAIVGSMYAAGYTVDELEQFILTLSPDDAKKSTEIHKILSNMLQNKGVSTFADLKIPFRCVAADVNTLSEVELKEGSLLDAVMASAAIPVMYDNVQIGDQILVDGGIYNNMPVDVAIKMGAEYIIAIDLSQENESLVPPAYAGIVESVLNSPELAKTFLGDATDIVIDYFTNRPDQAKYQENIKKADILIHPLLQFGAMDFGADNCQQMIEIGEKTAKEVEWNSES